MALHKENLIPLCLLLLATACSPRTGTQSPAPAPSSAEQYGELSGTQVFSVPKEMQIAADRLKLPVPGLQGTTSYPRSVNSDGTLNLVGPKDWTSGFYPGSLWLLYQHTGEEAWKEKAAAFTAGLEELQHYPETHDLGFMMFCSYGNGYRLTGNPAYKKVLLQSARTLASRFNPHVGSIKSWDGKDQGVVPVASETVMNLELLFWAANVTGDQKLYDLAVKHAGTTLKNNFRPDNSSHHLVLYDASSGQITEKQNRQGMADGSVWARGEAWSLYGYTMVYRETRQARFLEQALKIADSYLNHPNLPADLVPYWDFKAPDIPDAPRDASAAAIVSSALLELAHYAPAPRNATYRTAAGKMLSTLSSPAYQASSQTPAPFILQHSVGNLPGKSEVDVPVNFADYYYLEALLRYQDWLKEDSAGGPKAAMSGPRVFLIDGPGLVSLKKDLETRAEHHQAALAGLRSQADKWLQTAPFTITTKTTLPPSGNPHDYESQGPYWWPNPKTQDGLPYIRRDGEKNPEIEKLQDRQKLGDVIKASKDLSLAYYLTNEGAYAAHAATLLRTFFLDEATRMDPHLNYGQRIPGITDGRDIGIIETRNIGEVADAVGMLQGSSAWTPADQAGMENWARRYLTWLLHSDHGIGEARQRNNHGSWYDVQAAALALFVGEEEIARQIVRRGRDERLPKHIEPDGRQPHELARTRSWSYSVMNLQSFFSLAALGEKVGEDLWQHQTPDGRSLRQALDFLAAYATPSDRKPWPFKQITKLEPDLIVPLLYQASRRYPDGRYAEQAEKLVGPNASINTLLGQ